MINILRLMGISIAALIAYAFLKDKKRVSMLSLFFFGLSLCCDFIGLTSANYFFAMYSILSFMIIEWLIHG